MKRMIHESNSLTDKRSSSPSHKTPAGGSVDVKEGVFGRKGFDAEPMYSNSSENQRQVKGTDRV